MQESLDTGNFLMSRSFCIGCVHHCPNNPPIGVGPAKIMGKTLFLSVMGCISSEDGGANGKLGLKFPCWKNHCHQEFRK